MTMHLLPAYWTTNNHKKRKKRKVSKRMEQELIQHEKFLKKMGEVVHDVECSMSLIHIGRFRRHLLCI